MVVARFAGADTIFCTSLDLIVWNFTRLVLSSAWLIMVVGMFLIGVMRTSALRRAFADKNVVSIMSAFLIHVSLIQFLVSINKNMSRLQVRNSRILTKKTQA